MQIAAEIIDDHRRAVAGKGDGIGAAQPAAGASVVVNDLGGSVAGEGSDATPAQGVVDEIVAAGGQAASNADDV